MLTFKQLEAVYWVAQLGGFAQAAQKLHTTQSAISKRIQEIELLFDTRLFDRTLRTARLTEKGEEMVALAKRLLQERDAAVAQFAKPEVLERPLRLGVTELTAMTWLPRLVTLVKATHPRVQIQPTVSDSHDLRESLLADGLDLVVIPQVYADDRLAKFPLGRVQNAWMSKPGLLPARPSWRLHELSPETFLTQGARSGAGLAYERWLSAAGFVPANTIVSSNLVAIVGMTVSGLGLSHLPKACLQPLLQAGLLEILPVHPQLPDIAYVAAHKVEQRSTLLASIALLAQECCDFSKAFQMGAAAEPR